MCICQTLETEFLSHLIPRCSFAMGTNLFIFISYVFPPAKPSPSSLVCVSGSMNAVLVRTFRAESL